LLLMPSSAFFTTDEDDSDNIRMAFGLRVLRDGRIFLARDRGGH
ncbi:hypothetical protein LCGC14_2146140, partial [marine sediment metagenome]